MTSLELRTDALDSVHVGSSLVLHYSETGLSLGNCSSVLADELCAVEPLPFLPGKTDYRVLASKIAQGIRSGARSMIDACVLLHDGMLGCDGDAALKDTFLVELAAKNVIPKRSSRTGEGFEKSKLSMLRKIGANADLLLDERLFKYLEPGRSILFHLVRLYEELQGGHEQRVDELVKRLSVQGALSRRYLIDQIKLEEKANGKGQKEKSAELWAVKVKTDSDTDDFDVVLLTPSQEALTRLDQYSFDELSRQLLGNFRISNDGCGIAVVRLADISKVERLLQAIGLVRVSQVLLPYVPDGPIVTDETVVVFGERSSAVCIDLDALEWLLPEEALDVHGLAGRLLPTAKSRLHLFASAETEGWSSLIDQTDGSDQ
jgi:hypothetical protein